MGTSAAWELARHGVQCLVLERSVPGAEASSAAAGILGAQAEAHAPGPMTELCLASRARYAKFAATLSKETRIDVGYRECGVLRVDFGRAAVSKLTARRRLAEQAPTLAGAPRSARSQRARACALAQAFRRSALRGDSRVEPKALLRALHVAALARGVRFRSGAFVRRVALESGRAVGVALDDGSELRANSVVVAAGSWTSLDRRPRAGSRAGDPGAWPIVELELPTPPLSHVVFGPGAYLVPRDDGRLLVGSTLEFVGYEREVTAGAVRDLLLSATALVPAWNARRCVPLGRTSALTPRMNCRCSVARKSRPILEHGPLPKRHPARADQRGDRARGGARSTPTASARGIRARRRLLGDHA